MFDNGYVILSVYVFYVVCFEKFIGGEFFCGFFWYVLIVFEYIGFVYLDCVGGVYG